MAQRIIFVNLHASWMLVKNSAVLLFKNSAALKHKYLLEYLLNNPNYQVCNYINDRGFSIFRKGGNIIQRFFCLFSGWENRFILKKNGIELNKITVIRKLSSIRQDDIVILYNIMSDNYRGMEEVRAYKVLSMLHFHGKASEESLIRKAGINCLFCETDLSKTSKLYNTYYHIDIPWIIHPFVPAERFRTIKPFNERKNKCFSTGTITYKTHPEFLSVYGGPCDQPSRKFVMDNKDYFKETIDCYNYNYLESTDEKKDVSSRDLLIIKFYKKIYNRFHVGQQKKYFSFDMVEKFNDYKMHFVGEEILGVPGIGFVEGMACGSAFIGIDSPMYRDYGLIPGVHYISYDGSMEGLKTTIEFYQKPEHMEELERIAEAGQKFVENSFNGQKVAEDLILAIISKKEEWLRQN